MYNLVHDRGAPNNAYSHKFFVLKNIGVIQTEFFHPKYPEPEERLEDGEPWSIGKLELDYTSAVEFHAALGEAIAELEAFESREDWVRYERNSNE